MNNELVHHGVQGQKWGVRNGPPYPLSRQGITGKNYKNRIASKHGGEKLEAARAASKQAIQDNIDRYYSTKSFNSVLRRINKLTKITNKIEKGQKKADKANLKTAKEKSKTFFRNEEKISKASAKSDKLNAKQEKLYLEGKKEFERLSKEMYKNKIILENFTKKEQEIFNKWRNAIDKDTPINSIKKASENYDDYRDNIQKIRDNIPEASLLDYDKYEDQEIFRAMLTKGTDALTNKEIVEASKRSKDPSNSHSDLDISYQDAKKMYNDLMKKLPEGEDGDQIIKDMLEEMSRADYFYKEKNK